MLEQKSTKACFLCGNVVVQPRSLFILYFSCVTEALMGMKVYDNEFEIK